MSKILWSPDSCKCKLIVDENFNFIDFKEKCKTHTLKSDSEILEAVLQHNNNFNDKTQDTEEQKEQVKIDKKIEQDKINDLGETTKHE